MPKLLNVALERNQLFYFLMPAVKEIFQIVKFLRDFISSSISSLNISAFYMSVPYKPVPYKKKRVVLMRYDFCGNNVAKKEQFRFIRYQPANDWRFIPKLKPPPRFSKNS